MIVFIIDAVTAIWFHSYTIKVKKKTDVGCKL